MNLEEVKAIPMRAVVGRYGIRPNRAGFIRCPFHAGDREASMKVYQDHVYCFGCGWYGDQIDFVGAMENLDFKEAFMALGGSYPDGGEEREEARRRIKQAGEERRKREEKEEERRREMEESNRNIDLFRAGLGHFPEFSDEWCFCQRKLEYEMYRHDVLYGLESGVNLEAGADMQEGTREKDGKEKSVPESGTCTKEKGGNRMLNAIVIGGRCVAEPEITTVTGGGKTYTLGRYRVAVSRDYRDKKTGEYPVDYFQVRVTNGAAEFAKNHFKKGTWVIVQGRMNLEPYEKDGVRCIAPVIQAASHYPIYQKTVQEEKPEGMDMERPDGALSGGLAE